MAGTVEEHQGVLVTGGSRGIGAEIARQLCDAGHRVMITGVNAERLRATANRIGAAHVVADVAAPGDAERAVGEALEQLGRLDVLVNNAGISGVGGPLVAASPDQWWEVLRVNLYGPMAFMRAVLPTMVEQSRGLVVNVGSYGGVRPLPGNSAYGTSKAALARLTDSVATEVAGAGVVVVCASPGLVHTDMTREAGVFDDLPEEAWDPIERIGELVQTLMAHPQRQRLSGRFIHVRDDIGEIIENIGEVERNGLYQLGLHRFEGRVG